MKTLYRTSFRIDDKDSLENTFDKVAALCFGWVFDPARGMTVPAQVDAKRAVTLERTTFTNNRHVEAQLLSDSNNGLRAWGLRFSHPHPDDEDIFWTTEIGLFGKNGAKPCFSCSVSVSRAEATLIPIRQRSSRPRLIPELLTKFKCVGSFPLIAKPIGLTANAEDLSKFAKVLQDKKRTHPVVLISCMNHEERPIVDGGIIADKLAGLAHVVVATSPEVSVALRNILPNTLNAYDGGIRLYWPGFQISDRPFEHPLWTPFRISSYSNPSEQFAQTLLDRVASTAVFNLYEDILTWERLQSLARSQAIEEAKAHGKTDELLTLFEEENKSLTSQVSQLQNQLAQQSEELKKQKSLAQTYLDALEERKNEEPEGEIQTPATSVAEAISRAEKQHDGKFTFVFNNKSEHEECHFEAPEEVEKAFNWLATVYHRAKTGEESCNDLDLSIRSIIPGWSYKGGQKKSSVGKYEDWYWCYIGDQKFWLGEHIGCGTSTKPTETIRVAFAWDKPNKRIVVGFLGQHQRNSKS